MICEQIHIDEKGSGTYCVNFHVGELESLSTMFVTMSLDGDEERAIWVR